MQRMEATHEGDAKGMAVQSQTFTAWLGFD
jgi:hypothetical protein